MTGLPQGPALHSVQPKPNQPAMEPSGFAKSHTLSHHMEHEGRTTVTPFWQFTSPALAGVLKAKLVSTRTISTATARFICSSFPEPALGWSCGWLKTMGMQSPDQA